MGPATIRHTMARIRNSSRGLDLQFSFIHNEGNKPVGELMKQGLISSRNVMLYETDCPSLVRTLVRMERIGVPNLRCDQDETD